MIYLWVALGFGIGFLYVVRTAVRENQKMKE
jgi:hypothetical protein